MLLIVLLSRERGKYYEEKILTVVLGIALLAITVTGGLDYDESGNHREDGMIGWLFMQPNLIRTFEKLGVSACYLEDSGSYRKVTDFEVLNNAYEAVYEKRKEK